MTPRNPAEPLLGQFPVSHSSPSSAPSVDLLAEPTFEECVAHHSRYFDDRAAGRIDLDGVPEDHHVAYYEGQIVDHDSDPTDLLDRAAARLNIHPARIFIHYPWLW